MAELPTLQELGILVSKEENEGNGDRAAAGTRSASVEDAENNSRLKDNVDEHDEKPDEDDGNKASELEDAHDPFSSMHWAPEPDQGIRIVQVYRDQVPTITDDNRPGPIEGTNEKFEIDWIGAVGRKGRQWVVNVKWQGYPYDEMTWEPLRSIPKSVVNELFAGYGQPAEMKRERVRSDTPELAVGSQYTTGIVAETPKRPLETELAGRPSKRRGK